MDLPAIGAVSAEKIIAGDHGSKENFFLFGKEHRSKNMTLGVGGVTAFQSTLTRPPVSISVSSSKHCYRGSLGEILQKVTSYDQSSKFWILFTSL